MGVSWYMPVSDVVVVYGCNCQDVLWQMADDHLLVDMSHASVVLTTSHDRIDDMSRDVVFALAKCIDQGAIERIGGRVVDGAGQLVALSGWQATTIRACAEVLGFA